MKSLLLFSFTFLCLSQVLLGQQRFVEIEGAQIWIETRGLENRKPGQPLVIFESGAGTPMGNWEKVLDGTAKLAPLLTYDRPGIGKSEPIQKLPTIENVSTWLLEILEQLEQPPPYILVGHSLGGAYVRGFAVYHPEKLAGLIIIDPADFTETSKNIGDYYEFLDWPEQKVDSLIESFVTRRQSGRIDAPPAIQREGQVLDEMRATDFAEINDHPLPNIPVHILTGGRFDLPKDRWSKEYDELELFQSKMRIRSKRWMDVIQSVEKGMFFFSADAAHFVQWDDPELVVSSISIVLSDYKILKGKE